MTYSCRPLPTAMATLYVCVVVADEDLTTAQLKDAKIGGGLYFYCLSLSLCVHIVFLPSPILLSCSRFSDVVHSFLLSV